jgi:hypothetical protein
MSDFAKWLADVDSARRDLAGRVIELIRTAGPEFEEAIKWGNPTFAVDGALRCYVATYPEYVHLGLFNGASLRGNLDLVEGTGKRMRHVKLTGVTPDLEARLQEMVRESASLAADASG